MLGEDVCGLCSAYGILATTIQTGWQVVGGVGGKADDVRITDKFHENAWGKEIQ